MDRVVKTESVAVTLLPINELKPFAWRADSIISAERYRKMMSYLREADRLRSFAAALLLRKAAKGHSISYTEGGKPFVPGIGFNVSHSGDYAVLAEAGTPVGVDIEKIVTPIGEWVKEALGVHEYQWMKSASDENEESERFYILWTRKESLVKCEGIGLTESPAEIETVPVSKAKNFSIFAEKSDSLVRFKGKSYGISSMMHQGHAISVALEGKFPQILAHEISAAEIMA